MNKITYTILNTIAVVCIFTGIISAQNCYIRLTDVSGYTPTPSQLSDLEMAACRLRDSFPEIYRDSFKVYDFGFYLHHKSVDGSYPAVFQQAINDVKARSKYYLLFGKQTDETGIYTKFWVDLNLPDELLCAGANVENTILDNVRWATADKYSSDSRLYSLFSNAEIEGIKQLEIRVTGLVSCCIFNINRNPEMCTACPDEESIKRLLEEKGYLGVPVNLVNMPANKLDTTNIKKSNSLVEDNAKMLVEFLNVSQPTGFVNIGESISNDISLAIDNNVLAKGFVTKNFNFCDNILYSRVLNGFADDGLQAYIHLHLWENPDSTKPDLLFSKFKENTIDIELPEVTVTAQGNICGPLPLPIEGQCCETYAITQVQGIYFGHNGTAGNWTIADTSEHYRRRPFDEAVEKENFWDNGGASIFAAPSGSIGFVPSFRAWLFANFDVVFTTSMLKKTFDSIVLAGPDMLIEREKIVEQFTYPINPSTQQGQGTTLLWPCDSRLSASLKTKSEIIQITIDSIERIISSWLETHSDLNGLFLDPSPFKQIKNPDLSSFYPIWAFQAFGGTQGIHIEARSLKHDIIPCYGYVNPGRHYICEIYFSVIDNFGVGFRDAARWYFPGLVEQWVLQHYRNYKCDRPPCFIPITHHSATIYHKFEICTQN